MRRLLIGCLGAVLLVSCGDAAGDPTTTSEAGTSTSSTGSTTTSVPASTTAPPIPVLSDLTGNWENERAVLRVNDGGDYVVLGPDADPDQPLTVGFVARDEVNVIFVSGVSGECPGETGVYGAVIDEETLTLTLVDDPCTARAGWFELPFTLED